METKKYRSRIELERYFFDVYILASRRRLPFLHVLNVVHATSTCNIHLQQPIHFQPIAAIFQEKNVE